MPIEGLDAHIQDIISRNQLNALEQKTQDDSEDASRRRREVQKAAKRSEEQRVQLKGQDGRNHQLDRHDKQQQVRFQHQLQNDPGLARAFQAYQQSPVHRHLPPLHRSQMEQVAIEQPVRATQAATSLADLGKHPAFPSAINSSELAGTLHEGVLRDPRVADLAQDILDTPFMREPKADPNKAKPEFLRMALNNHGQIDRAAIKKAGEQLGNVALHTTPNAQRAVVRAIDQGRMQPVGMEQVDRFIATANDTSIGSAVKGRGTELLVRTGGDARTADTFGEMVRDPKFQRQSSVNQQGFFDVVAAGRPVDFPPIAHVMTQTLRLGDFPDQDQQVKRLLNNARKKVADGGPKKLSMRQLIAQAKAPPMPVPPRLLSQLDAESEEQRDQIRAQNRAAVLNFMREVMNTYDDVEKRLKKAQYYEQIQAMRNLESPPKMDVSGLPPDEQELVAKFQEKMETRFDEVQDVMRKRARARKQHRKPLALIRKEAEARREEKAQAVPSLVEMGGSQTVALLSSSLEKPKTVIPRRPVTTPRPSATAPSSTSGGPDIAQHVNAAIARASGDLSAPEIQKLAKDIAAQVSHAVVQEITERLASAPTTGASVPAAAPAGPSETTSKPKPQQVDGWGIPRSFAPELGGPGAKIVKPATASSTPDESITVATYTGPRLVTDVTAVREVSVIFESNWKDLSRAERALLQNLGWSQPRWDTRSNANAMWPRSMQTVFVNLTPIQRRTVIDLGISAEAWNGFVKAASNSAAA